MRLVRFQYLAIDNSGPTCRRLAAILKVVSDDGLKVVRLEKHPLGKGAGSVKVCHTRSLSNCHNGHLAKGLPPAARSLSLKRILTFAP